MKGTVVSPPSATSLSPLIGYYVAKASEDAEIRTRNALTVLRLRDLQVRLLQDRVASLEYGRGQPLLSGVYVPTLRLPPSPGSYNDEVYLSRGLHVSGRFIDSSQSLLEGAFENYGPDTTTCTVPDNRGYVCASSTADNTVRLTLNSDKGISNMEGCDGIYNVFVQNLKNDEVSKICSQCKNYTGNKCVSSEHASTSPRHRSSGEGESSENYSLNGVNVSSPWKSEDGNLKHNEVSKDFKSKIVELKLALLASEKECENIHMHYKKTLSHFQKIIGDFILNRSAESCHKETQVNFITEFGRNLSETGTKIGKNLKHYCEVAVQTGLVAPEDGRTKLEPGEESFTSLGTIKEEIGENIHPWELVAQEKKLSDESESIKSHLLNLQLKDVEVSCNYIHFGDEMPTGVHIEVLEDFPQWLLEEAVNANLPCSTNKNNNIFAFDQELNSKTFNRNINLENAIDNHVDTLKQQQNINKILVDLKRLVRAISSFQETAKLQLKSERVNTLELERILEEKILNMCNILIKAYRVKIVASDANSVCSQLSDSDESLEVSEPIHVSTRLDSVLSSHDTNEEDPKYRFESIDLNSSMLPKRPKISSGTLNHVTKLKNIIKCLRRKYKSAKNRLIYQEKELETKTLAQNDLKYMLDRSNNQLLQFHEELLKTRVENDTLNRNIFEILSKNNVACDIEFRGESLKQTSAILRNRVRAIHRQLTFRVKEVNRLKQELENSQKCVCSLKKRAGEVEANINNKQKQVENYKQQILDLNNKLTLSSSQNERLATENKTLKVTINNLKTQISQIKGELSQLTTERSSLLDQIFQKDQDNKLLKEEARRIVCTHKGILIKMEEAMNIKLQQAHKSFESRISVADKTMNEAQDKVKEMFKTIRVLLKMALDHKYTRVKAVALSEMSLPSQETQNIALSFLNMSQSELQELYAASATNLDQESEDWRHWVDKCRRFIIEDTFADELANYLYEIIMEQFA